MIRIAWWSQVAAWLWPLACMAQVTEPPLAPIQQGGTLHVQVPAGTHAATALQAVMHGRRIPLFRQENGAWLGLMPVPVDLAPGPHKLVIEEQGGAVRETRQVEIQDAHFPIQNIVVSRQTKALTPLPGEMEAVGALLKTVSRQRFWTEPLQVPTPQCMNSPFGVQRYHNGKPSGRYHKGLDLRSPMGTPVHATTSGLVKIAQMFRLHGGTIGLDHGQGLTSMYLHLSRLAVAEGTTVQAGDVVGYVGATGFATGPHLHWAVYVHGMAVNPRQWQPEIPPCAPRR